MDNSSIDGYGLTYDHLNEEGRRFISFAIMRRIEDNQAVLAKENLTVEQRQAIAASYRAAKASLNDSQKRLLEAIAEPLS